MSRADALHGAYLPRPEGLPWMIGLAPFAGGTLPCPLSERDVQADTAWALRVYDWLGLVPGGMLHLIGDGAEEIAWWPFQNAAMRRRIPWIEAEGGAHDTARSDMVLRRFRLQAVLGLSEAVLDAQLALGRDPARVLAPLRALTAAPAAAERLRALGVRCWTQRQIGPLFAFEPPEGGGARYDESEWMIESLGGELALTAVQRRAAPFVRLRSGVRGRVEIVDAGGGRERRVFVD